MADIWDRVDEAIDTDPLLLRDIVGELLVRVEQAEAELEENTGVLQALRRQRDKAEAAIERVRNLHLRDDSNPRGPWCNTCLTVWPCATARALTMGGES